ncbi:hypothetical protein Lal_00037998, partial [Lupinus albus]
KITLSGVSVDVSGLPNVVVSRHIPSARLERYQTSFPCPLGSTNPCASVVHMEPFPYSSFKIYTDDRSARAHAPGFAVTAAPSYSSGPGPCPDGRFFLPKMAYLELSILWRGSTKQPRCPTYLKFENRSRVLRP